MMHFNHSFSHLVTMLSVSPSDYTLWKTPMAYLPQKSLSSIFKYRSLRPKQRCLWWVQERREKNRSLVILIRWSVKLRLPDVSVCIWVDGNPSQNPLFTLGLWNGGCLMQGVKRAVGKCRCVSSRTECVAGSASWLEQVENMTKQI